ncbi:hypothetical protein ACFQ1E_09730 [Sphingomonas canadensis]|uniref:5-bromo-4-chloroindolyl phosphate hydrolase n=1 Tax=Sphingomonas canadensis TaxID=1219257 RepID=A0ABW3H641_9SPHN|nr:hypothetical protein [Sphingomonas canadensis]MCW3836602.1 hypothetical protein [Sphingomonas canadensis]
MPTEVDNQIARASELLNRARERHASVARRARRTANEAGARIRRILIAVAVILASAFVAGLVLPGGIGMTGVLGVIGLLIAATILFAMLPAAGPPPSAEKLAQVPLKALPVTTERWLETQRPALPAPARSLVDSIGVKLEMLAPQLATLDEQSPAAQEVRKLVGEQLPELIKGYGRVPEPLRAVERNGMTPDQQLADSLRLIDGEIAEMSEQLAQGDIDALETRGRYLQIKYRDEDFAD